MSSYSHDMLPFGEHCDDFPTPLPYKGSSASDTSESQSPLLVHVSPETMRLISYLERHAKNPSVSE